MVWKNHCKNSYCSKVSDLAQTFSIILFLGSLNVGIVSIKSIMSKKVVASSAELLLDSPPHFEGSGANVIKLFTVIIYELV
jgi:hypothetical protein